ncbi:MAG TPA: hypothetical protein VN961_24280, partial [Streptosporangiaceae bacterium]|nr:hypothetical protein [Streptosporangiaceae bacterium]
ELYRHHRDDIRRNPRLYRAHFGLAPLAVNDKQAYPFNSAFNYHQAPLRPARTIYRPWPPDAYHVNMNEANQDT